MPSIASPIEPKGNFAGMDARHLRGGVREVDTVEDRDDIATDLRRKGMRVRVTDDPVAANNITWELQGDLVTWTKADASIRLTSPAQLPKAAPNTSLRSYLLDKGWLSATAAAANTWRAIAYAPSLNRLVAVSDSGTGNRVMTSDDGGESWTARASAADISWNGICWAEERKLFVAVGPGTGNGIMTSPDGITWTTVAPPADITWSSVCWSPELGLFCACASSGSGNRVMTSPDGVTWTMGAQLNAMTSVCWSPELGLFCGVGEIGSFRAFTSPDGMTWSLHPAADTTASWRSVTWANRLGLFVAVNNSSTGNRVMTSPDGVTWTASVTPADNSWRSVAWAEEIGLLTAVSDSGTGNRVMTSTDGVTWALGTSLDNNWYGVCWCPQILSFVAVARTGASRVMLTRQVSVSKQQLDIDGVRTGTVKRRATLAALLALDDNDLTEGDVVRIGCRSALDDGGGGGFVVLEAANNTWPVDNKGLIFGSAGGGYVFIREEFVQNRGVNPRWFGAPGDGSNQDAALDDWLDTYQAVATALGLQTYDDRAAWLNVPPGVFKWSAKKEFSPQGNFFLMKGAGGYLTTFQNLNINFYGGGGGNSCYFPTIEGVVLDGLNTTDIGLCIGHPTDWEGGLISPARWGGVQEGRFRGLLIKNYSRINLLIVRDNHSRFESVYSQWGGDYGMVLLAPVDTEWLGCHWRFNRLDGIRIQPWAGNNLTGIVSDLSGGLSFTDCVSRYNGRHNFFGTGGDRTTLINKTGGDAALDGHADIEWFDWHPQMAAATGLYVGDWWESYFWNCSWANLTTGTPPYIRRELTITSIAQDTTNANEIRITTATPHYMQRGVELPNANSVDINGTGIPGYDTPVPRNGAGAFTCKEVYSETEFALNVAYVSAWSGTATIGLPNWEFKLIGQEKGYNGKGIRDIWFIGKNHNFSFFERVSYIYAKGCRFKTMCTLGDNVVGFERDHSIGLFVDATDEDNFVGLMGAGYRGGHVSAGLRQFEVPYNGYGVTGTTVGPDKIGYAIDRPTSISAKRTDHIAGAARDFMSVHWRSNGLYYGRWNAQDDTFDGWKVTNGGNIEWVRAGVVRATLRATDGIWQVGTTSTNPVGANDAARDGVIFGGANAPLIVAGFERPASDRGRMNTTGSIDRFWYNGALMGQVEVKLDLSNNPGLAFTGRNTPKAFGIVTFDGSGVASIDPDNSFGVSSIVQDGVIPGRIQINFAGGAIMANTNYIIMMTPLVAPTVGFVEISLRETGRCKIDGRDPADTNALRVPFSFVVYGKGA